MYVVRNPYFGYYGPKVSGSGEACHALVSFKEAKKYDVLRTAKAAATGGRLGRRHVYKVSYVLRWFSDGRPEEYRGNGLVNARKDATRYASKEDALADTSDWERDGYQGDRSGFRVVRVLTKVR